MDDRFHCCSPKGIVLLMTASVDPRDCPDAKFKPKEREFQYRAALAYNIRILQKCTCVKGIVFAENSGYDLSVFRENVPNELMPFVEFIGFSAAEFDSSLGKSYNEELLVDKVLDCSRMLADENSFFLKVTGRYPVMTLKSHICDVKRRLPDLDWICDVKDHRFFSSLGLKWNQTWCDTRCIGFRKSFWMKYIYGRCNELRWYKGGPTIENQMFSLSRRFRDDKRCVFRFSQGIRIGGLNGGNHVQIANIPIPAQFQQGLFYMLWIVKTVFRKVCPWFWL